MIKEKLIRVALVFLVAFPFFITILFSVVAADDFLMFIDLSHNKFLLVEAFEKSIDFWHNWGGGVPYIFIEYFFNPLNFFTPYGYGAGIVLIICFIIFLYVLRLYICEVIGTLWESNEKKTFGLFLFILFMILNTAIYNEIFYWFVGSSYLLGFVFMMLNQILIVRFMSNKNTIRNALALSIIGFIACFGYQLAVFSGVIYLIEIIRTDNYKIIKRWIPLGFMILGGVVSAFAPGNFVRKATFTSDISFSKIVLYIIQNGVNIIIKVFTNPIFILMACLLILFGIKYGKANKSRISFYIIGLILSLLGILFPIAYAQHTMYLPNRVYFMANTVIVLWSMSIFIQIGEVLNEKGGAFVDIIKDRTSVVVVLLVLTTMFQLNEVDKDGQTYRYENLPWFYTIANINNVHEESKYYKEQLKEIYLSDEEDVEVVYQDVPVTGILYPTGIGGYTTDWVNEAIAEASGKHSVKLVFQ